MSSLSAHLGADSHMGGYICEADFSAYESRYSYWEECIGSKNVSKSWSCVFNIVADDSYKEIVIERHKMALEMISALFPFLELYCWKQMFVVVTILVVESLNMIALTIWSLEWVASLTWC